MDVLYPLDETQRDIVLDIERVSEELLRDLGALKARGAADDILQATLRQAPGTREGEPDAARQLGRLRHPLPGHDAQQPGDRLPPGAGAPHSGGRVAGSLAVASSSRGARARASLML